MAKVLQYPIGQFISASLMIKGHNTGCFQIIFSADLLEHGIKKLPTVDITFSQFLTEHENLAVEKSAFYADNKGNILAILFPDPDNHMSDHFLYRLIVIGVFVFATKLWGHNQLSPVHLHSLKALFLSVGRFNPVTAFGIIIVQHHHIDAQIEKLRLLHRQSPNKLGSQRPGKGVEKPFDPVGRSNLSRIGFNTFGIAWMSPRKLFDIGHETTGTVSQKTQDLFEKLEDFKILSTFSDRAEKSVDQRENPDLMQIAHKKGQPDFTGQTVAGDFNCIDFQFLFSVTFAVSVHEVFYFIGLVCGLVLLVAFNNYASKLILGKRLFYFGNRSVMWKFRWSEILI